MRVFYPARTTSAHNILDKLHPCDKYESFEAYRQYHIKQIGNGTQV